MKNKNLVSGALVILVLLVIGLACSNYGTKLDFKNTEVYYTKNITEAEAKKFGEYIVKEDLAGDKKSSMQLDKSGSTYQVRMVYNPSLINDEKIIEGVKIWAKDFSTNVFNNAPTEIHLCDDSFKTLKVVTP